MATLKQIIKRVDEEMEKGLLVVPELGSSYGEKIEVFHTGCSQLDNALDIGGLPRGRIVEILGQEAAGKSTLVMSVIAQVQKQGFRAAYIDTEHSFDRHRAQEIGVDFEKLAISQPSNAEQALDLMEYLIDIGEFGVVALDSVAALVPKLELEGGMEDSTIGLQARLMGKALRKITGRASKTKTLVLFTNQLRDKLGFNIIPMKVSSGGNALKYYASVRLEIARTKNEIKKGELSYTHHKITIKKNKLGVPFKVVNVKIGSGGFINAETQEIL